MNKLKIDERLDRIEKLLLSNKTVLTFDEAADYIGMSRSYLHKLTSKRVIPFSKPNGKMIFFDKKKLDLWLLRNKSQSRQEIKDKALNYTTSKKLEK